MRECNHEFESMANTFVRTHAHDKHEISSEQEVYDVYTCDVCHAFTVHAYRELVYVPKFDARGQRAIKIIGSV